MYDTEVTLTAAAPLFVLKRRFAAPPALVYRCFTDPSHLCRWWGPRGFSCPVCEVDPREGGHFRIVMRGAGGVDYPLSGTFRELVPGRRIVREESVAGHPEQWFDQVDPGRRGQYPRDIPMLTTITFEDAAPGTLLSITTQFPSLALRDNFAATGMKEGWSASLDKLEDLVNALKEDESEINITRLLQHPVARVFAAFSNPAGMALWWGPDGFRTTTRSMQFKVGGVWDYVMHGPDGTDYPNYVSYTRIEKDRLIAYDHGTDAGHPALFRAVIGFTPHGTATRVNLKLILENAAERPHYVAFGAVEGGYQNLARLEAWLDGGGQ